MQCFLGITLPSIFFLLYLSNSLATPYPSFPHLSDPLPVDIIITVKTGISILHDCVASLMRQGPPKQIIEQRIIFVDDGSPPTTLEFEKGLCERWENIFCIETSPELRGYTYAVNLGVQYSLSTSRPAAAIVILNSDTYVTRGWLEDLMVALFQGDDGVVAVGPLSNAATWQSIPSVTTITENGGSTWSRNEFPRGLDPDTYGHQIRRMSNDLNMKPFDLTILNGFCFALNADVFRAVGFFDSVNFPKGYGEEVDFFLRLQRFGFRTQVVPSAFVYHVKTASFTSVEKSDQKRQANSYLTEKYSNDLKIFSQSARSAPIEPLRRDVSALYDKYTSTYATDTTASILFVLHNVAVGGGTISVLQEVLEMRKLGINCSVSIPRGSANGNPMEVIYSMFPSVLKTVINRMVHLHDGKASYPKPISQDLVRIANSYDIVVATFCLTMSSVAHIVKVHPHIMPAYYVQDYEPWFLSSPFARSKEHEKDATYKFISSTYANQIEGLLLFAKTNWTSEMVSHHHKPKPAKQQWTPPIGMSGGAMPQFDLLLALARTNWTAEMEKSSPTSATSAVKRVEPSIDHLTYYPDNTLLFNKMQKIFSVNMAENKFRIIAMIRPRTARRNPASTLDTLLRLAYTFPRSIHVTLFGCSREEIYTTLNDLLAMEGPAPHRTNATLLNTNNVEISEQIKGRMALANLFRKSDIFIDMSWWQAFGRTAVEAMACGCIPIMPSMGAGPEICQNGKACLYHDGNDPDGFFNKVMLLVIDRTKRAEYIMNGIARSLDFSLKAAAASMNAVLQNGYKAFLSKRHNQVL